MYLLILAISCPPVIFTSHYVSINSRSWYRCEAKAPAFTSHYVSINSTTGDDKYTILYNLHPTMYLLILTEDQLAAFALAKFTSHYVSINSRISQMASIKIETFTSHYVSINSYGTSNPYIAYQIFTSHYVSINSSSTNPVPSPIR